MRIIRFKICFLFICSLVMLFGTSIVSKAGTITITENPQDVSSCFPGEYLTFSVKAEGNNLRYVWKYQKNGDYSWYYIPENYEGYGTDTVIVPVDDFVSDPGEYFIFCNIIDSDSSRVQSDIARFTVIVEEDNDSVLGDSDSSGDVVTDTEDNDSVLGGSDGTSESFVIPNLAPYLVSFGVELWKFMSSHWLMCSLLFCRFILPKLLSLFRQSFGR